MENKNRKMTLCKRCAADYIYAGYGIIRNFENNELDLCDFCCYRNGKEYYISPTPKRDFKNAAFRIKKTNQNG